MTVSDQPTENPIQPPTEQANAGSASSLSPSADIGGLIAGAVFTMLGVLFLLEAGDVWTFALSDLRYLAPLGLIVIGAAVLIGGMRRAADGREA